LRLGGPRAYAGVSVDDAWIGSGRAPSRQDIKRALRLYRCACGVHVAGLTLLALVIAQA
jgi:adenosylcobinamide-phosphate synthase